ncbi:undecaprenyl-diphosphate phosphatase [Neobacillus massiliamazoniensis]|uniref:Undecaprenyl-diphosphatase n=1 Tax=Neobacillus massiliamazoniensis TaxID=1499688 RepID=A0A0U1P3T7_9BACI|nr:undecaprenyl-diphosphate phosphatase [Neobacillus massiliamazoniensis]CRK84979.1 undecaprenyl-diphosphatase [Neobacillus massiliamazoniensis]
MDIFKTIVFAIIQGITELFPISSVAHGVLTPYVFHWNLSPEFLKEHFLPYVVMLHLGTAIALLVFFWRDWLELIRSIFNGDAKTNRKVLLLLIVATLPAAIIGLVFEKKLTHLFSSVTSASFFLIINGFFLYFGEKMRNRGTKEIKDLNYGEAVVIGFFQSLALIPGFSRSGSSMTAGFWMGLKHEASAKMAMLLATPVILGASVLELPKIAKSGTHGLLQMSILGGVLSGIFAYISVMILMKWFKRKEINAMRPFAIYCWVVGTVILVSTFF